ncbi:hypothetical protein B0H14DRAFT_3731224 [Mycena olivaceomarginata]|nr:hypothetical protein B0H14DRAFT_3731224 [Mycena olivaceomarginata]
MCNPTYGKWLPCPQRLITLASNLEFDREARVNFELQRGATLDGNHAGFAAVFGFQVREGDAIIQVGMNTAKFPSQPQPFQTDGLREGRWFTAGPEVFKAGVRRQVSALQTEQPHVDSAELVPGGVQAGKSWSEHRLVTSLHTMISSRGKHVAVGRLVQLELLIQNSCRGIENLMPGRKDPRQKLERRTTNGVGFISERNAEGTHSSAAQNHHPMAAQRPVARPRGWRVRPRLIHRRVRHASGGFCSTPKVRKCRYCGINWSAYPAWKLDLDMELLEEDIERYFKAEEDGGAIEVDTAGEEAGATRSFGKPELQSETFSEEPAP